MSQADQNPPNFIPNCTFFPDHNYDDQCLPDFDLSDYLVFLNQSEEDDPISSASLPPSNLQCPDPISKEMVGYFERSSLINSMSGEEPRRCEMDGKSRVALRMKTRLEVVDDGFKWRKYGKKIVKSNPNPSWVCSTEISEDQVLVSEFTAHRHDFISYQTSSLVVASMLSETMIPSKYHKSKSLVSGIINTVHSFSSHCPKIIIFFFELEDQPGEWFGAAFATRQEKTEEALFEIATDRRFRAELSSQLPPTIGGARMVDVILALMFPLEKGCSDASDKTEGSCSICLSELSYGEQVAYFPCSHIYHKTCIRNWLKMGKTFCPLCRFEVLMVAFLFI